MTNSGHRLSAVASALVGALALAACGGGNGSGAGGAVPDTADLAPSSAAFYVSVESDPDGEQWQQAQDLLRRFPSGDRLLADVRESLGDEELDYEQDIKPALGPEVGVVGLTLEGERFAFYTKPPNRAKLEALLREGDDPVVFRELDGWTVAAETEEDLDAFDEARARGVLADDETFADSLDATSGDAGAVVWVRGEAIQDAVEEGLIEEGAPSGLTEDLGVTRGFLSVASAEDEGVRTETVLAREKRPELDLYRPKLDEQLPAEPLLFVSVANLDEAGRAGLDLARKSIPDFSSQLAQGEAALGFSLEDDVLPLLAGEAALVLYDEPSAGLPVTVDYVLDVGDEEEKARRLMERVVALVELGEVGTGNKVTIDGFEGNEIHFMSEDISIFWAVYDGTLAITSSRDALAALRDDTPRLADDQAYGDALDAADVPDEVVALTYLNLPTATPLLLDQIEKDGTEITSEVRGNLQALRSTVSYATTEDVGIRLSGFVGIG
ncbi:MAG: DUF3352 domain-containing protein [Gaiellaceae bacterium]